MPVTAIIPRDFSTELIAEFTFSDWIDFRSWHEDPDDLSMENLLSQIPQSEAVAQTGERLDYLRAFIQDIELALAKMPTSYASLRNGDAPGADAIRPRMIQPGMLTDWDFKGEDAGSATDVENLLAWSQANPRFRLRGEDGSGKTFFARLLALKQAQAAIRDESEAIPVWLDLARWDERYETLEAFVESQWRLLTYWRHWLDERQTLIILDNFSDFAASQPDQALAVTDWIEANPGQRFIVLSRLDADLLPALPTIQLCKISEVRAQSFASGWLSLDQQNSFRAILKQKSAILEQNHLDDLSLGVELMSADRALAFRQWHADPMPALLALRVQQTRATSRDMDNAQLLDGLRQLAWTMTLGENQRSLTREFAISQSIDARIIDHALELGLLEASGECLRFQAAIFQWHLAAAELSTAGLDEVVPAPEVTVEHGRVPGKWDRVALALVDGLSDEDRPQVIKRIADKDPMLAAICLRRHPALIDDCLDWLITKLIRYCAPSPLAQSLFQAAIAELPVANQTAELLIGKLGKLSNARQAWLWREIRALPLDLPAEFIQLVAEIDRESAISVADQLPPNRSALSLAYLVSLTRQQDAKLRRNAIWMLGEIKYLPTAIFLMDCLEEGETGDHDEIVLALMKFAHAELLARVLRWSQEHRQHRPVVIQALAHQTRLVSSRLLEMADARRLTLNPTFYDVVANADESDIALGLAQIAAESVDLPETVESAIHSHSRAEELRRRLEKSIRHLPNRESFQQLVADIHQVLKEPPEPVIVAGSKVEALLYGKPLFDDPIAGAAPALQDPIPAEPGTQIQPADAVKRLYALQTLAEAPASEALPLLLDAARDPDVEIRLAAYRRLSRFAEEEAAQKAVFAALADPSREVVEAATELLKAMTALDCDALLDLLESENAMAVAAAIDLLRHNQHQAAVHALSQLVDDERMPRNGASTIGMQARQALEYIEASPKAGDEQSAATGDAVQLPHSEEATSYSDEEKIRRTLEVLRDDDWGRTQKAAKFLRRFARHLRGKDHDESLRLLCAGLNDDNWSARWACAEALAMLRDRAAIPALGARLDDPSWIVQVTAIRALVELGARGQPGKLTSLLVGARKAVREAAAEALGELGDSESLSALGECLMRDADEFVRLAALKAICKINPEDARAHLQRGLGDGSVDLRYFALRQLAPRMKASDLPILQTLLDDDNKPAGRRGLHRGNRQMDNAADRN